MWPDYKAALKGHGVIYQMHSYLGPRRRCHNNSTLRYNEAAAQLV